MAANNYCQWCGRKYDSINSTASDPGYFCSKRCEVAAHKAGAAPRGRSMESRMNSCALKGLIFFLVAGVINALIEMCTGGISRKGEKQDNKATQHTEQMIKTDVQETQAARQSVDNVKSVDEKMQAEEALQLFPEDTFVTTSTNEQQMTQVDSLSENI